MKSTQSNQNFLGEDYKLTSNLSALLHKVLNYHDVDGLSQMVLHELGHDDCFGLKRATYLVDNPDFDHLLGVAGYCKQDCPCHKKDLWQDPYSFKGDMKGAPYHNQVQNFLNSSLKRKEIDLNSAKEVKELGIQLGIQVPEFFSWNMKHGNHGLLIFEHGEKPVKDWRKELLSNVAALLSFCGI